MTEIEAQKDLKAIKDIMERSVRFSSLSGVSGILAGLYACLGAYLGYRLIYIDGNVLGYRELYIRDERAFTQLAFIAAMVLLLSVVTGLYFSYRKAKKDGRKLWDRSTRLAAINFLVPFSMGSIFILSLIYRGYYGIISPITLLVYGVSLYSTSKYTLPEVRTLGIVQMVLGLFSAFLPGYGIVFWTLGFGIAHIVFGILMHKRYKE